MILLVLFCLGEASMISAQEKRQKSKSAIQAHLMMVKHMSENWTNKSVELHELGGRMTTGKFININRNLFRINASGRINEIPVLDVQIVVVKKTFQDIMLAGLMGIGTGALFAAMASLETNSQGTELMGLAVLGAGIGFTLGWKTFYRDRIIPLE